MALHNDYGRLAEQLAVDYLSGKGYQILERNWQYQHHEIDIIASFKNLIIVAEVKARNSNQWESPESSVSASKIRFLSDAIERYLNINNIDKEVRFDVISIISHQQNHQITHIEEAFHPIANR